MNETELNELITEKLNLYDLEVLKTSLYKISTALNQPVDEGIDCKLGLSNFGSSKDLLKYTSKTLLNKS
jgi:hypothetical protein